MTVHDSLTHSLCSQMRELGLALSSAGVQRLVVSVDEEDGEAAALWSK